MKRKLSINAARPPKTSADFAAVDRITRMAEAHGWRPPDAFFVAMLLHIRGVTPVEAEALFERRIQ